MGDGRERVLQNNLMLGAKHHFTPRLSATLRVNQGVFDTSQFNRANALSFGGTASSAYQLTPHHELGGGFSFSRQSFDETFNRPASDTDYYNLFGSWQWLFDETTVLNLQLGPALIHSNQDTPPPSIPRSASDRRSRRSALALGFPNDDDAILVGNFDSCPIVNGTPLLFDNAGTTCGQMLVTAPPDRDVTDPATNPKDLTYLPGTEPQAISDTRITYFATASLSKRWTPTLVSSLAYSRQDDTASGIDGGATLDAVILSTSWRISERWDASVRADWTQRQSATDGGRVFVIPGDQSVLWARISGRRRRGSHPDRFLRLPRHPALGGGGPARLPAHQEHRDGLPVRLQQAVLERRYGRASLGFRQPSRDLHRSV